jgi:hypothetical protein
VTPAVAAPEGERPEEGLVLPYPQMSGVLTVLPPFDVSALELGLQRFLEQLERVGHGLAGYREETGLYLWIVAGAVAATACEIARRQLGRCAGMPAVELNQWLVVRDEGCALASLTPDPCHAR